MIYITQLNIYNCETGTKFVCCVGVFTKLWIFLNSLCFASANNLKMTFSEVAIWHPILFILCKNSHRLFTCFLYSFFFLCHITKFLPLMPIICLLEYEKYSSLQQYVLHIHFVLSRLLYFLCTHGFQFQWE